METITINVAICAWGVFWVTYWVLGGLMSWRAHVNNVRRVTDLKEVISVLILNMMWTFIGVIILCLLPIRSKTDAHIIIKLFFTYVITDVWFYHLHYFAHNKQVYKYLHKKHHRYRMPWALTALYCTGYEAMVINGFAVGLGPILFQIPPFYLYIWFFLAAANSVATHSGYKFYFLIDGAHDIHHYDYIYNYGASPYIDMLYGTYKNPSASSEKMEMDDKDDEIIDQE